MDISLKKTQRFLFIATGAVLLWNIMLNLPFENKTTIFFTFFNIGLAVVYAAGSMAAIHGSKQLGMNTFIGKGIFFTGCGMIVNTVALALRAYYMVQDPTQVPYPSPADFFLVLFTPLLFFGLYFLIRMYSFNVTARTTLESAGVLFLSIIIVLQVSSIPEITFDEDFFIGIFDVFYIFTDVIFITLAFIISRTVFHSMFRGLHYITTAVIATTVGHILFSLTRNADTYWVGNISDTCLLIAGFFFSYGIIETVRAFRDAGEEDPMEENALV